MGEREGGWDRERSSSRASNSGRPKPNGAICRALPTRLLKLTYLHFKDSTESHLVHNGSHEEANEISCCVPQRNTNTFFF